MPDQPDQRADEDRDELEGAESEPGGISYWKDPWSALTHFAGFWAALVGLGFLVVYASGTGAKLAAFLIYGISLALLFLSSASYHYFDLGERGNLYLRQMDHSAIFLLIGGTYIPPVVHLLDGAWRVGMLIAIGGLAAAGVVFKLTWFHAPRWLNAGMYVVMGWLAVIPGKHFFDAMGADTLTWVVLGGAFYTVGAVVYALKWPDPWPEHFGFHEVWHLFVLAGAGAHFAFVWTLMDVPVP